MKLFNTNLTCKLIFKCDHVAIELYAVQNVFLGRKIKDG